MRGSGGGGGGGGPGDPRSCPRSPPRSLPPCPLPRQDSFYSDTSPPLSLQWRNLSGQSCHQGTVYCFEGPRRPVDTKSSQNGSFFILHSSVFIFTR